MLGRSGCGSIFGGVAVAALFEQGLAQHAVGIQVLGIEAQDVARVRNGLVDVLALDQVIKLLDISSEGDIGHVGWGHRWWLQVARREGVCNETGIRATGCSAVFVNGWHTLRAATSAGGWGKGVVHG